MTSDGISEAPQPARLGDELEGRVALVTGGTRGIGAAICRSLTAQGAAIAAGYSGNAERAAAFAAEIGSTYGPAADVTVHQGNISVPADCRRVVDEVLEKHGRLDILINNAGITNDRSFLKMSVEDWTKVIAVNLSGTFFMSQAALEHMLERGSGRVINLSSIVGETGNIGQANYAASKSGLFGLTKTLALETSFLLQREGRLGIAPGLTVNAVTPGFTATEMVETIPEKVLQRIISQIPVHRMARPDEIARVVQFLAADSSSYITGQVWGVNGGMDM